MKSNRSRTPSAVALGLLCLALAAPASAADEPTLTEVVNVLRANGLIDEDEHAELAARAAAEEDKRAWTERISLWGDFRGRYEGFFYEQDIAARSTGTRLRDRHRFRYRARLNARGEVASRATVYLRLVSGGDDPRSTNQTFGSGVDFDSDDLRLDLAYATLSPFPDSELPGVEGGLLAADVGKVPNPFVWKELGQDSLLWDNDITLEGGTLRVRGGSGPVMLFSNTGAYVIDENSASKDPALFATQLGGTAQLADTVQFGTRGTFYHFFKLDNGFFMRGAGPPAGNATGGNFADGLSRRNNSIQVLETSAFLAFDCWELVPVKFFGSYAHNLSARSSRANPGVGPENDAYAVGVLIGDKKQLVQIGSAWYYVEANAFPSMFLDSDILDGTSNREGWAWSLTRQLLPGVDFVYTAYLSDRIEGGVPYQVSILRSDRFRMRFDLKFKF